MADVQFPAPAERAALTDIARLLQSDGPITIVTGTETLTLSPTLTLVLRRAADILAAGAGVVIEDLPPEIPGVRACELLGTSPSHLDHLHASGVLRPISGHGPFARYRLAEVLAYDEQHRTARAERLRRLVESSE